MAKRDKEESAKHERGESAAEERKEHGYNKGGSAKGYAKGGVVDGGHNINIYPGMIHHGEGGMDAPGEAPLTVGGGGKKMPTQKLPMTGVAGSP